MNRNAILGAAILGVVAFGGTASAQDTATGTLTVTGAIVSSISLTIESAGGTGQTGMGTSAASTGLGNVSKFGALPTGFSIVRGASDYTLTSSVGVTVVKANSASTAYTLNAKLSSAPASGVVWKLASFALNAATVVPLTAAGVWGSTPTYAWDIVIDDSVPAGAIDNVIEFDALAG